MIHPDALGIARRLPTVNHRGGVVRVGEEIREVRGELQRWSWLQRELRPRRARRSEAADGLTGLRLVKFAPPAWGAGPLGDPRGGFIPGGSPRPAGSAAGLRYA